MWVAIAFAAAVAVYLACALAGHWAGGATAGAQESEWLVLVAEGCGGAVEGVLRRACARWRRPISCVVVIDVAPADEARAIVERLAPKMAYEVVYLAVANWAEADREVAAIRLGSAPDVRVHVIHVVGGVIRTCAAL
ncbi:hypothetical protein [Alicyclobacillus acidocaldarius]|uniref:Uncharacterized protein n=1 Tax=Alicyclobacillus acidocaldarius (strain Tc-4-1) TaxID=1048834 RepID=F8IK50_ALIAT|nr:hypothetical protein [Alicyclobacillus acidocaldarius]AEJ44756.1 hypothetical protein TC41_2865 [Alicyclobacillus acidocaldarius subsp. acidocaldarius Tc-4-1]